MCCASPSLAAGDRASPALPPVSSTLKEGEGKKNICSVQSDFSNLPQRNLLRTDLKKRTPILIYKHTQVAAGIEQSAE